MTKKINYKQLNRHIDNFKNLVDSTKVKPKAIVFFDLDGTFLDNHKNIPKSNLKSVKLLKINNILPVICTGRNILLVQNIMKQAHINTAICGNGNYIEHDGYQVFKSHIKRSIMQKLVHLAKHYHNPIAFQTHDEVALNSTNSLTAYEYKCRHHVVPPIDPKFYLTHHLVGCNIFTKHNDKIYQKAFSKQLSIVRNSDTCLDVQNKGINKGKGVQELVKHMHLDNIPTYAFGDGRNDLPMLKTVDYGIAMKNGWNFIQASANYVTDTNEHQGILKGLKHYQLI